MSDNKKEKKDLDIAPEELNEEELKEKANYELIVERLEDSDEKVVLTSLNLITEQLKHSTGSVTSVPKPVKFLRPHYEALKVAYYKLKPGNTKIIFADVLSVLAITMQKDGANEVLKFRLESDFSKIVGWGYEYLLALSGELGTEWSKRIAENSDPAAVLDLIPILNEILPEMKKTNHECDACDLLMDVGKIPQILEHCDKDNYKRVCLYLYECSQYKVEPDNKKILQVIYDIYMKKDIDNICQALRTAFLLNDFGKIKDCYKIAKDSKDKALLHQVAFMLGAHNIMFEDDDDMDIEYEEEEEEEEEEIEYEIEEIMGNQLRNTHFIQLATSLDLTAPKDPKEIYKEEAVTTRTSIDEARRALADSFVNGFVNCGFSKDKLSSGAKWISNNREHGRMSAIASIGLLHLWDSEDGVNAMDKYLQSSDSHIKGGALLGTGILNAGIRSEITYALLEEHLESKVREEQIGSILGFGIAFAGHQNEEVNENLIQFLNLKTQIDITCFAALSLGMINIGSANSKIAGLIIDQLTKRPTKVLKGPLTRFMALGLGLLYLNKQNLVSPIVKECEHLSGQIKKFVSTLLDCCAYAGTGNVLKIQNLLKIAGEHNKDKSKDYYEYQDIATIGIAMIALGEELGSQMSLRMFDHLLRYCDPEVKKAVPLAIALINISNPSVTIMDTLSKLSHDSNAKISQSAILGLGLVGAGTNNARIAKLLRQLHNYYIKDSKMLFIVKVAQGILYCGKGLISLSPFYSDRQLIRPVAIGGLITVLLAGTDMEKLIFGPYHYLIYFLSVAMRPRMLITLDEKLNPIPVSVRVGQAVDVVGQAGKPKTITGFQTQDTPVVLHHDERAEMATDKYIPVSEVLEGVIILKKNPKYKD